MLSLSHETIIKSSHGIAYDALSYLYARLALAKMLLHLDPKRENFLFTSAGDLLEGVGVITFAFFHGEGG